MMDSYTNIASNKHFHIIPVPVFEYLCSLDITRAQQNIFVFLYGEAHINGGKYTEIATKTISQRLSMSRSTVKRAYKALMDFGLIKRHDQGRCRFNPMRSAITKTEITIPDRLRDQLEDAPDRSKRGQTGDSKSYPTKTEARPVAAPKKPKKGYIALHDESEDENPIAAPAVAYSEEGDSSPSVVSTVNQALGLSRNISMNYAIKLRELLRSLVEDAKIGRLCNEILWSLEEGHLAPYPVTKGRNIALKLIRQGRWREPKDMPVHWQWNPV